MILAYERTGGFAGIRQRLEIDGERKQLNVTDRHTGSAVRKLTDAELQQLDALIAAVNGEKPPPGMGESGAVSDTFTLQLWLGGAATPALTLNTLAVPLGEAEAASSPWAKLLAFVDGLLTSALEQTRPAGAPRILSAKDLE